jgi:predicted TIM-barrel fold metal-dependent hydrolase
MTIVDFRIRPPFKGFLDTLMYSQPERRDRFTRQLGFEPSPAASARSCDLLIGEMDAAGIDVGVVVGRNSGFLGSVANSDVAECAQAYPGRFIAVASIALADRKKAVAEIAAAMSAGFKAINIEPGAQPVPMEIDDRRLYPIYAHCEDNRVPVIVLAGGNAGPDIGATVRGALDRVLADFPTLKVAAAHGGWPWVHQILHVAFRRPNLYLSPDMYLANMPGMSDYLKAADGFLAERFMYGSSFPLCPVKGYRDWFETLPLKPENKDRLMRRNALAFLDMAG